MGGGSKIKAGRGWSWMVTQFSNAQSKVLKLFSIK